MTARRRSRQATLVMACRDQRASRAARRDAGFNNCRRWPDRRSAPEARRHQICSRTCSVLGKKSELCARRGADCRAARELRVHSPVGVRLQRFLGSQAFSVDIVRLRRQHQLNAPMANRVLRTHHRRRPRGPRGGERDATDWKKAGVFAANGALSRGSAAENCLACRHKTDTADDEPGSRHRASPQGH